MSEFNNVTVTREANVYFDGNVTSRAITFADGTVKTLGIMMPGDYTFGTAKAEVMEILAGSLRYRLAGSEDWLAIKGGESFNVPSESSFDIQVSELSDYCCSYID
mgnify:FL=1|jgi:uncharacterized protein YaiE (UPF0345 family)